MQIFTNRLLVKMEADWSRSAVESWAAQFGMSFVRSQSYDASTYLLEVATGDDALARADDLRGRAGVVSVAPDRLLGLDVR